MSRNAIKNMIDILTDEDVETIYKILVRFVPEDEPAEDEVKAIEEAKRDIELNGTVPHSAINWD